MKTITLSLTMALFLSTSLFAGQRSYFCESKTVGIEISYNPDGNSAPSALAIKDDWVGEDFEDIKVWETQKGKGGAQVNAALNHPKYFALSIFFPAPTDGPTYEWQYFTTKVFLTNKDSGKTDIYSLDCKASTVIYVGPGLNPKEPNWF